MQWCVDINNSKKKRKKAFAEYIFEKKLSQNIYLKKYKDISKDFSFFSLFYLKAIFMHTSEIYWHDGQSVRQGSDRPVSSYIKD